MNIIAHSHGYDDVAGSASSIPHLTIIYISKESNGAISKFTSSLSDEELPPEQVTDLSK